MRTVLKVLLLTAIVFGALNAQAKKGTAAEAEALVKKAVAFLKANGQEKALEEFSNPKGKFVDKDLYIFVDNTAGVCMAHGGNPKLVGKETLELKDADGKAFVKERIETAKAKGKGWQTYKWTNNTTKKIETKEVYFEKAGDLVIGCGAYKK